jgi:predicted GNAT superfamily acetyltransferase
MKIAPARIKDIMSILSVQDSVLIKNLSKEDANKEGFLIYPINANQLRDVIHNSKNLVLCAKEDDNNITGYLLAYDFNNWLKHKPKWLEEIKIPNKYKSLLSHKKIIYLRHIARKRVFKGVGDLLLKHFIKHARTNKIDYIICEILEKYPKNKLSIQFFKEFGFKRIGSIRYRDRLKWGVYIRKI